MWVGGWKGRGIAEGVQRDKNSNVATIFIRDNCITLIHIAINLHQDIPYVKLVMACTRIA